MPIDGFELREDGKQSGLLWVTFSNIQIHSGDKKDTPEYIHAMKSKAALVDRVILTEFRHGTKHYSRDGERLKTPAAVLHSYRVHGGYFVDLPKDRRWKLEGLIKTEGIIKNVDASGGRNAN